MSIFAISDLHLPGHQDKPMDVFGSKWDHHFETISSHWKSMITAEDIVLIPGDISWAMQLSDAMDDLNAIAELPGIKLLVRGNHDYWWSSVNKIRSALPQGMHIIQNDALRMGNQRFCGTRGWNFPLPQQPLDARNEKIYQRELARLKLSLDAAMRLGEGELNVLLHFPPLFADGVETAFTELLHSYPVKRVVYGHLHGPATKIGFVGEKEGVMYSLVSCDALSFSPIQVG